MLRRFIPSSLRNRIKEHPLFIKKKSRYQNVYHCTIYRTGSQWIRHILNDYRVIRYSGLRSQFHAPRLFLRSAHDSIGVNIADYHFEPGKVITLYTSSENFFKMSKNKPYAVFFVYRDPRDITVSHYFATLRSAQKSGNHQMVNTLIDPNEGILFAISQLEKMGLFSAMRSWGIQRQNYNDVLLLRFETLTGESQFQEFKNLFQKLDISMPDNVLKTLLKKYNFETLSKGRKPGEEDRESHYRIGITGDWMNHFTSEHCEYFKTVTKDLAPEFGYQW